MKEYYLIGGNVVLIDWNELLNLAIEKGIDLNNHYYVTDFIKTRFGLQGHEQVVAKFENFIKFGDKIFETP